MNTPKKLPGGSLAVVLFVTLAGAACAPQPPPGPRGLEQRLPVKRFLSFPRDLGGGAWRVGRPFPRVRFDWAVRAVYQPRGNRYFVIEREGKLWSFKNEPGVTDKVLVLDLSQRTQGYYDCGLLGIAFHPDYGRVESPHTEEIFLWYNYTERPQGSRKKRPRYRTPSFNRLSRFELPLATAAATIDPASEVVLIDQYNETTFHEGGAMFFHPDDGFLYLSLGDDFNHDNTQRLDRSLFSGVIRIDVDQDLARSHPIRRQPRNASTAHYTIPNDNPFLDPKGGVLEEFWALGLRSPHMMTLDRPTGRIFVGDVGHTAREEIDLLHKGGNYEWPLREGRLGGESERRLPGQRVPPLFDYPHADGNNAVIGGIVYRGKQHPQLHGQYVFGDNGSNRIWAARVKGDHLDPPRQIARLPGPAGYVGGLSSITQDAHGELMLVRVGPHMPLLSLERARREQVALPQRLSETGAFARVADLEPVPGVLEYTVNVPHWGDGARARHFIALPWDGDDELDADREQMGFSPEGEWRLPKGTVLIQHLELPVDAAHPERVRPIETRFVVAGRRGGFYVLSYRWREDGSDADLVPASGGGVVEVPVRDAQGQPDRASWFFPSRAQCRQCHAGVSGGALGLTARQLNRERDYPRATDNQLRAWSHAGLFAEPLDEATLRRLPRLTPLYEDDKAAPVEARARSYLDANCSGCHRPGSVRGSFDARLATPLDRSGLLDGDVLDPLGMQEPRIIKAGDSGSSLLYMRLHAVGAIAMPPVGKQRIDTEGIAVVGEWIEGLPPN